MQSQQSEKSSDIYGGEITASKVGIQRKKDSKRCILLFFFQTNLWLGFPKIMQNILKFFVSFSGKNPKYEKISKNLAKLKHETIDLEILSLIIVYWSGPVSKICTVSKGSDSCSKI